MLNLSEEQLVGILCRNTLPTPPSLPFFSDITQINYITSGTDRLHLLLLKDNHRLKQVKDDPADWKVGAEGFGISTYTGLVPHNMPHMMEEKMMADVLLNLRLKWQLLRGSATSRVQRIFSKALSCCAFTHHSRKKCEQQWKASLEAKETGTLHTAPITQGENAQFVICLYVKLQSANQLNYNSVNHVTENAPVLIFRAHLPFFMDSDLQHHNLH